MYEVNPNKSTASEFGVNKGEAQVLNLQPSFDNIQRLQSEKARKDLVAQKEKGDEDKKRYADIAGLKSIAILPADRQIFADKTKAMTDYVYQNARALHEGDPKAIMGFQNIYADLATSAENSKNYRTEVQKRLDKINENRGAYEPEDVAATEKAFNTPNDGKYDLSKLGLNKVFNTDVELRKFAEENAKTTEGGDHNVTDVQGRVFNRTPNESGVDYGKAILKAKIEHDPNWLGKANREFNKLPQDQQASLIKKAGSPVDAISDNFVNQIFTQYDPTLDKTGKSQNPLVYNKLATYTDLSTNESKRAAGTGADTKVKYLGDYTENPDGKTAIYDFRPVNKGEMPTTQITDPDNPKAKIVVNPTRLNIDKNDLSKSTMDATVVLSAKQVSDNEKYKEDNKDVSPSSPDYKLPHPEKVVLPYPEASSIMQTNLHLPNIAALVKKELRNQIPGHISNKYTDLPESATAPKEDLRKKYNY